MTPKAIDDVRCPICLDEFENNTHASAGDQLVDHLTDEHDHFSLDAEDTCPLCAAQFKGEEGGPSAGDQLIDHVSSEHGDVYSRGVKIGLAGGV